MKLLLHTHTVMSFILGLTALGMFLHLVRLRPPVKAKGWLITFYLGLFLWQMENMVRYSLSLDYVGTLPYKLQSVFGLILFLSVTLIAHEQYVYRFLVTTFKKEQRVVLWISILVCFCEVLFAVWNEWYNNSDLEMLLLSAFLLGSLFTIWIIIVAFRKAIYLRRIDLSASKAHFIYAAINGCYVLGSTISLIFGFFSTPGFWSYFLFVWFGNLASIVLYITTAAVPANFQTKVTGFTYVLAATILTVITLAFYPPALLTDIPMRLAQREDLIKMLIITGVVALLIVMLMPFMLKISLTRPMQRLLDGVQHVNEGNLDVQLAVGLQDEIGQLTMNFNQMTQNLKKAKEELTQYAQTLEKRVADRTAQLQQSLNELKEAQTQLIHSEKMASLGELIAGIAHEIKNPLNFINNFSELGMELVDEMQTEISSGNAEEAAIIADEVKQNLQKINHHGKRADAIMKSMLEHSRASKGEKQLTDINALVDEYLRLSYHGLRARDKSFNARMETQFDEHLEKINIIPQDIGRVLLNLFNNAFYAVNEKKKLLNGAFEPVVSVQTKKTEDHVEIRIRDNGTGIPQKVLDKIYEPFFTTKPAGQGTGLGLSLSYDIVTQGHGGEMKVETKEGEYTEFVVELPV